MWKVVMSGVWARDFMPWGGLRRGQKETLLHLRRSKDGREWLSFKGLAAEMSSGGHVIETGWLDYESRPRDRG